MKMIKGPAIFLAQFASDTAPFNSFESICKWAASLGYIGVQIPTWDGRLFDVKKAADSQDYADEVKGIAASHGLAITELSTHLQGQLVAVHPAYDAVFDGFAVPEVRGNPKARTEWAVDQVKSAIRASKRLGLTAHATFSGALAWPYIYPCRNVHPASSRRRSTSSRGVGGRSSTRPTRTASILPMKFTQAKICTTASPTRCSSKG